MPKYLVRGEAGYCTEESSSWDLGVSDRREVAEALLTQLNAATAALETYQRHVNDSFDRNQVDWDEFEPWQCEFDLSFYNPGMREYLHPAIQAAWAEAPKHLDPEFCRGASYSVVTVPDLDGSAEARRNVTGLTEPR